MKSESWRLSKLVQSWYSLSCYNRSLASKLADSRTKTKKRFFCGGISYSFWNQVNSLQHVNVGGLCVSVNLKENNEYMVYEHKIIFHICHFDVQRAGLRLGTALGFWEHQSFHFLQCCRTSVQLLILNKKSAICHISISFGSSMKELQSIAFSGWNSYDIGELSTMIAWFIFLFSKDKSFTKCPSWKTQFSRNSLLSMTLWISNLSSNGSAYFLKEAVYMTI